MRLWLAPLAALIAVPAVTSAFAADAVPTLDVRQSCRGGSDTPAALESCLKSEADARELLVKSWSQYPAAQRRICVDEAGRELPSYVEILTCLQIAKDVKSLPKQDMDLGPLNPVEK